MKSSRNKAQEGVSLCIPIYKPDLDFFMNLKTFLVKVPIPQVVIIETLDNSLAEGSESKLRELIDTSSTLLTYGTTLKERFKHGSSRNDFVRLATGSYLIFTTQDVNFTLVNDLPRILNMMLRENLAGVTLCHTTRSPTFQRIFEKMFKELSLIDMHNCLSSEISWWSNNFSIYRKESLIALPFPPIFFAEDLYWAKLARSVGLRLKLLIDQNVSHLNSDTCRSAFSRGKLEAMGHFEGHVLLGMTPSEVGVLRRTLGPFIFQIRNLKFEDFRNLLGDLKVIKSSTIQNYAFARTWNQLMKRGFN